MPWMTVENYLGDLTVVSLVLALLLYLMALWRPLRAYANTALLVAWVAEAVLLVGHLAATGKIAVWWVAIWWIILWHWILELPLATRTIGIPTTGLSLLFLAIANPKADFPIGVELLGVLGLLMGMALVAFALCSSLLFLLAKGGFRRASWINPELITALMVRLSQGALPFLFLSIMGQMIAWPNLNYPIVIATILAFGGTMAGAIWKGDPWFLGMATLASGFACNGIGLLRF